MFFPCVSMYLFGTSPPGIVKIPLVRKKLIRTAFVRLTIIVSSSSAARRGVGWTGARGRMMDAMHLHRHRENARIPLSLSFSGRVAEGGSKGAIESHALRLRRPSVPPSVRPSAVPPISLSLLHYQNGWPAPRPVCLSALLCSCQVLRAKNASDGWMDG